MMAVRRLLSIAVCVLFAVAGYGQLHGSPPSITSIRPGTGVSNYPAPSVTSMGPNGADGVSSYEISPYNPNLLSLGNPQFTGLSRHAGTRHRIGNRGFRSAVVPAVVPYYVPYYMPAPGYPLIYPGVAAPATSSDDSTPDYETAAAQPDPPAADPPVKPAGDAAPVSSPDPPADASTASAQEEATILIFRDGHRMEIHNYAIAGDQVLNFSNMGPRRIPLSDLDIAATQRANDERGVEFQVPAAGGH